MGTHHRCTPVECRGCASMETRIQGGAVTQLQASTNLHSAFDKLGRREDETQRKSGSCCCDCNVGERWLRWPGPASTRNIHPVRHFLRWRRGVGVVGRWWVIWCDNGMVSGLMTATAILQLLQHGAVDEVVHARLYGPSYNR